jgi:ABC-type phosphate/phosphonate transport system substrate-binding protein
MKKEASLPMYGCLLPTETNRILWEAIRINLSTSIVSAAPDALNDLQSCHKLWTAGSALLFTQTCGYPLINGYSSYMKVVGTPIYNVPGCHEAYYRSALITSIQHHKNYSNDYSNNNNSNNNNYSNNNLLEFLQSKDSISIAVNSFESCSGFLMFLSALAEVNNRSLDYSKKYKAIRINRIIVTGSHIGSIKCIQNNIADIASIDCISLELARIHCPGLYEKIRIIGLSPLGLAPPYATYIDSSKDLLESLRVGLQSMIRNESLDVKVARSNHLLVGICTDYCIDDYRTSIQSIIDIINKDTYLSKILSNILSLYDLPLVHNTVIQVEQEGMIRIELLSRIQDQNWTTYDFKFLNYLKRYLIQFLWERIDNICSKNINNNGDTRNDCDNSLVTDSDDDRTQQQYSSLHAIDTILTPSLLIEIIQSIVGRQIWPLLPTGDKPKVIFCTVEDTLCLMREVALYYDSSNSIDILSSGLYPLHYTWKTISHIADLALALNTNHSTLNDGDVDNDVNQVVSASLSLNHMSIDDNITANKCLDPYYAGFMGAASQSQCDYFSDSTIVEINENIRLDNEVRDRLWDADIDLSNILIKNATSFGIIAYISSPIHNDRNDWGNLVIAKNEQSILKWRDSQHHSSVRANIAPYCYDHIRLHRGVLYNGLAGIRLNLERTLFLGPVEVTSKDTADINDDDDDDVHRTVPVRTKKHFEKQLAYWKDIQSVSSLLDSDYSDKNSTIVDIYDRIFPGSGGLTLKQCKAKLQEHDVSMYVTVG